MYGETTGYREVVPRKLTSYQLKKHGKAEAYKYVMQPGGGPRPNQVGSVRDMVSSWKHWYRTKGLDRYGKFNTSGGLNTPYVLFKAKNVTDPLVRSQNWRKVRPIAPGTKHPMRVLLGKAGRAWYFAANQDREGQFAIPNCGDVPQFLETAHGDLLPKGEVETLTYDIEGCFPNMPKEAISLAMKEIAKREQGRGHEGVWVPHAARKKCAWENPTRSPRSGTWLPWDIMLEVLEFAAGNAYVRMPDSTILWQAEGIPMGDPLSPGMTIGTCAWMEREWMQGIAPEDKAFFRGGRYMDDIVLMLSKSERWDRTRFLNDFMASECYWPPLKLEAGTQGVFLETWFETSETGIRYRLKNDNEKERKVWRYHHYYSDLPYQMKRATLLATLRKVHRMASDASQLAISALSKLDEFAQLRYPVGIRKFMCAIMARDTSDLTWRWVRKRQC